MTAEILKIEKQAASDGGFFWYIFFKDKKGGRSYRACVYERFRNFAKWKKIIAENITGLILSGLDVLDGDVVDADSDFTIEFRPQKGPAAIDPVTSNASKRNVATVLCGICGKKIDLGVLCQMTINVGAPKDDCVSCGNDEKIKLPDEYTTIKIHLKCRDDFYNRIGKANIYEKEQIDAELIAIAKASKEGEK